MNLLEKSTAHFKRIKCVPLDLVSRPTTERYNPKPLKLSPKSQSQRQFTLRQFRCWLHTFFTFVLLCQCIFKTFPNTNQNNLDFLNSIMGWLIFVLMAVCTFVLHTCLNKCSELKLFLNGLVDLSNKSTLITRTPSNFSELLEYLLVPLSLLCGLILPPFIVFGFHWQNPCKTSLIGYFLLEECHSNTLEMELNMSAFIRRYLVKIMVYIANIWTLFLGINGGMYAFVVVQFISSIIMRNIVKT